MTVVGFQVPRCAEKRRRAMNDAQTDHGLRADTNVYLVYKDMRRRRRRRDEKRGEEGRKKGDEEEMKNRIGRSRRARRGRLIKRRREEK